jgi:hypothetical protein
VWLAASVLFSWYVENFGSYNKTYGSLGAIVGFMTWIWISIIVVLIGAKLDAEMEHQTARETTSGRPKPLGTAAHGWPTPLARRKANLIFRHMSRRREFQTPSFPGRSRFAQSGCNCCVRE